MAERDVTWHGAVVAIGVVALLGVAFYVMDQVTKRTGSPIYGVLAGAGVLAIAYVLGR